MLLPNSYLLTVLFQLVAGIVSETAIARFASCSLPSRRAGRAEAVTCALSDHKCCDLRPSNQHMGQTESHDLSVDPFPLLEYPLTVSIPTNFKVERKT